MTNITITVDDALLSTIDKLASLRSVTPEVYLTEYITAHLVSQYKANIVSLVTSKKLPDLVTMETAIAAIDESVKVRDTEPFVPLPEGK